MNNLPDKSLRKSHMLGMVVLLSLVVPLSLSRTGSIAGAATNAEEKTQAASNPPASAQVEQEQRTLAEAVAEVQRRVWGPATPPSICVWPVAISSRANGRFVSTELGYSGINYAMLRARATVPGPSELYRLCYYFASGTYTFYSFNNNRYVTVETGYNGSNYGMLRARATTVGNRERFRIESFDTFMTIRSVANNRLVSAELGYGGNRYAMLRARATAASPLEEFQ